MKSRKSSCEGNIRQRSCPWNSRQRSGPWNIRQRRCPWSRPPCNEGVSMEADAGPCVYAVLANLMGLASVVLLAFPAWYVAHYALLSARLAGKRDTLGKGLDRSEEHTSELQSLMRISYAVFCLKKKTT